METPSPIAATVPRILPKLKSRETPSTTAAIKIAGNPLHHCRHVLSPPKFFFDLTWPCYLVTWCSPFAPARGRYSRSYKRWRRPLRRQLLSAYVCEYIRPIEINLWNRRSPCHYICTGYQTRKKCTKWIQNEPDGYKIFQISIKYSKHFTIEGLPKFTQTGIFGLINKPSGNPGALM
jgi:hypothetical protein